MKANQQPPGALGTVTVPVHQEQLHVGTRVVDTGRGVRVQKKISEQPHAIDQTLLHDELEVTRVAVDRIVALSDAPAPRHEGDTYIVPVLEEILVVEKRLRIKEELHIKRVQRPVQHADTVFLKSEELIVERFDESDVSPQ
ncbi:MAG: YsnF/AvaK domain-containing protein [Pseudomonadota bacterium]